MKNIYIYMILLLTVMASCKKEKALNVDITKSNLDTYEPGPLDDWLKTHFLDPYNIEVLYRFDRYQTDITKEVAPVMMGKVQPIMEGVDIIFIKPYLELTSKAFLLPMLPKEIALFGSAEYSDNQRTLGTADAGRQINLYEVNLYDKNSYASILGPASAYHTVHHEFAHILHQNIPLPPTYELISNSYVGSSWVGSANPESTSRNLGYITRYARSNKDDDFAEMVATLLVHGQDYFNAYVNLTGEIGAARLRLKEQAVVDYYKSAFGIDFRLLQASVQKAIETYAPVSITTPSQWFGNGAYKGFNIKKNDPVQGAAFTTAFNTAILSVAAEFGLSILPEANLSFTEISNNRSSMLLQFATTQYKFYYNLKATITSGTASTISFELVEPGGGAEYENGTLIEAEMKPLLDYFINTKFKVDWVEDIVPGSKGTKLGFYDATTGALAFYSTIQK